MDNNKYYTENELIKYLNRDTKKRQGKDRLIQMCRQAGLIIEPIEETLQGKGKQILYRILEDNYNIPNEIWVDVYCSSDHEVSNLGRIRQKATKKLMGSKTDAGYISVGVGKITNLRAHRIVFFSFHPEYLENESQFVIDHINGKRDDNRLDNLRIITNLENIRAGKMNQKNCQTLLAQLLLKFGYEETKNKLLKLLENE